MLKLMAISEMLVDTSTLTDNPEGLKWYKTLTLNQRINLKDSFEMLCGVGFQELNFMLSLRERITLMYSKLIREGII